MLQKFNCALPAAKPSVPVQTHKHLWLKFDTEITIRNGSGTIFFFFCDEGNDFKKWGRPDKWEP